MNFSLPVWTEEFFPDAMQPMSKLSLYLNVYNEPLLKMKAGPLITKIATSMKDKSEGNLKPQDRKMFMYVGHDSTIVSVLEGMKVWDQQIPGYNIMTMIELHEDDKGWNVQVRISCLYHYHCFSVNFSTKISTLLYKSNHRLVK